MTQRHNDQQAKASTPTTQLETTMKLVLALASIAISLAVGASALDDARIQRNLRLMEKVGGKRRSAGDRMLADLDGSMSMANALPVSQAFGLRIAGVTPR